MRCLLFHPQVQCAQEIKESMMDQEKNGEFKEFGTHALHGIEDAANVVAHGVGGAVKGVADGVESVSATTKEREETSPDHNE
jgi:hypothetical protein